jgi:hypothetical protein
MKTKKLILVFMNFDDIATFGLFSWLIQRKLLCSAPRERFMTIHVNLRFNMEPKRVLLGTKKGHHMENLKNHFGTIFLRVYECREIACRYMCKLGLLAGNKTTQIN